MRGRIPDGGLPECKDLEAKRRLADLKESKGPQGRKESGAETGEKRE